MRDGGDPGTTSQRRPGDYEFELIGVVGRDAERVGEDRTWDW
jgi:hypothetical protein